MKKKRQRFATAAEIESLMPLQKMKLLAVADTLELAHDQIPYEAYLTAKDSKLHKLLAEIERSKQLTWEDWNTVIY